jgi:ankyrin repeat protein
MKMIKASQILESIQFLLEERIVLNPQAADDYAAQWAKYEDDPEIKKWLDRRLRLYLINDFRDVIQVTPQMLYDLVPTPPQYAVDALDRGQPVFYIRHIATAHPMHRVTGHDLEDNVQLILNFFRSDQRPRNLLAVTYQDALKMALQWDKIEKKRIRDASDEHGVKEIAAFDGIRWVQVLSDAALDREGEEMHNCISAKDHSGSLAPIYSLRDSRNKPHCSIEILRDKINQVKGYNNDVVEPQYHEACRKFLNNVLDVDGITSYCVQQRDMAKIGSIWDPDLEKVVEDDGIPPFDVILERVRRGVMSTAEAAESINGLKARGHEDIDVDTKDRDGKTLLTHAVESKDDIGVTNLLNMKADPDVMYDRKNERTLLYAAVQIGRTDPSGGTSVVALIHHGKADVNWQDKDGMTPLMYALTFYQEMNAITFGIIKVLVEASQCDVKDDLDRAAIHYACMNPGMTWSLFEYIVNASLDVINDEDRRGEVPLTIAAAHGKLPLIEVLVNTERVNAKYVSAAIDSAREEGHNDVVEYLEDIFNLPNSEMV